MLWYATNTIIQSPLSKRASHHIAGRYWRAKFAWNDSLLKIFSSGIFKASLDWRHLVLQQYHQMVSLGIVWDENWEWHHGFRCSIRNNSHISPITVRSVSHTHRPQPRMTKFGNAVQDHHDSIFGYVWVHDIGIGRCGQSDSLFVQYMLALVIWLLEKSIFQLVLSILPGIARVVLRIDYFHSTWKF